MKQPDPKATTSFPRKLLLRTNRFDNGQPKKRETCEEHLCEIEKTPDHLLIVLRSSFVKKYQSQSKQEDGKTESESDKYDVSYRDFERDYARGFKVISKLLAEARAEGASAEIVARLSWHAAQSDRWSRGPRKDDSEKDLSISIEILNKIVQNPQEFLEDKDSGNWYFRCVQLLGYLLEESGEPVSALDEFYKTVVEDIDVAMRLNPRDRLIFTVRVRVLWSYRAGEPQYWQEGIDIIQPVINQVDELLKDKEGASQLCRAVSRQALFIINGGEAAKSIAFIETMCKKVEQAPEVEEAEKITYLCMMRVNELMHLRSTDNQELYERAWTNYQDLRKRAKAYSGPKRAEVLRSCIEMDEELIPYLLHPKNKYDYVYKVIHETKALIENNPKLQDPEFGVLDELGQMVLMTAEIARQLNIDRKAEARALQDEILAFIKKYKR